MKKIICFLLSLSLFWGSVCSVYATREIDELKEHTSELENELSGLNQELDLLESELNKIFNQIEKTSAHLETTKQELATALGREIAQHDAMMLRIQSMYENGSLNIWETLLSSSCIADFISRAEYIVQINQYDRQLLKAYSETREQIKRQQDELEDATAYLNDLQADLSRKEQLLKSKINSTSSDLSKFNQKLADAQEAAKRAEEQAKEPVQPIIPPRPEPPNGDSGNASESGNVSYAASDVELLAALIECEAGYTNYAGMLAVGSVVVNRMKHHKFPNTLYGVVYHPGQFPPAHDGKVNRILKRGVKNSCVQAATDALNGKNNVGSCLYFRSASSGHAGTVIGGNVFF